MTRDRDQVLSRRRALMLAAAASATACPRPCLSEVVCLSPPPEPEVPPCTSVSWVVFVGPATAVDPAASARLDQLAKEVLERRLRVVVLRSRIFDDGHADTAANLHEPRLAAVEEALVARGLAATQLERASSAQPLVPAAEWLRITADGNPLTQSGLIELACA